MNQERINELDQRLRQAQGVEAPATPTVASAPTESPRFPDNHLEEEETYQNTETGDEGDQASKYEMKFIAAARKAQEEASKPQTHPDFDGVHCVDEDCGEPIPELRLKMGRIYCVHCQEKREKLKKIRGY